MEKILARLSKAKRPLILAGHGVTWAHWPRIHTTFQDFIERINIPVVTTQMARDLMDYDHPLYIGTPGVKGDRAGGIAIQTCDVLLILGSSLHPTTTGYDVEKFAPHAFKIHVDIDESVFKRSARFVNFVKYESLSTFIPSLAYAYHHESTEWHTHLAEVKAHYDLRRESNRIDVGFRINYYDVIDALNDLTQGNEIIIADAGSAFYITGQAWRKKGTQTVILPGGLAQMGYATSASIGAAMAQPGRQVIVITGDGSLQTNVHDLAVIAHHKFNVKLIVLNNDGYSCIKNTQSRYFSSHFSGVNEETGVSFPSLTLLAHAYTIPYTFELFRSTLRDTLTKVLLSPGPEFMEIVTKETQEIQPLVESYTAADGTWKSGDLGAMSPPKTD